MYSKRSYTRMRNLFTRTEHLLRRLRRIELMNAQNLDSFELDFPILVEPTETSEKPTSYSVAMRSVVTERLK